MYIHNIYTYMYIYIYIYTYMHICISVIMFPCDLLCCTKLSHFITQMRWVACHSGCRHF